MATFLIALLASAFAADPTIVNGPAVSPEAAPITDSHIVVIRRAAELPNATTMAIVLWFSPDPSSEFGKKLTYTNPSFQYDSDQLFAALYPRSDVQTLVVMNNPTAAEVTGWLATEHLNLDGDTYREIFLSVAGPATGGDTDEERLLTRDVTDPNQGGLSFTDLVSSIVPLTECSVWLLDASRNITGALDPGATSFGPTANDITMRETLVISSSASGRYGNGGLLIAAADVIKESKGGKLTLNQLYYGGIKVKAATLDTSTSMGILPNDGWDQNFERSIFIGGPLIAPVTASTLPKISATKHGHHVSSGWYLAGGGALALIGGGITTTGALNDYGTLTRYNLEGGESQSELDTAVNSYRTNVVLAGGLGGIGVLALAGGLTWAALDHGHHTVTITPTANGAVVSGQF